MNERFRRITVFGVVFGAVMGVAAWQAGGILGTSAGDRQISTERPDTETELVPISRGAGLGAGSGVRIERDGVAVVDGQPITYRAFEAWWARQSPRPGGTHDQRRLHAEEATILFFHRRPTARELRPPAVEGPDTTRLDADRADLTIREGKEFKAELEGNVVVRRHEIDEDLVLRADRLSCDAETRQATTDDHVRIEGRGTSLDGDGLDADLDIPRATIHRNVRGEFFARPGALTGTGGVENAAPVPTIVTCTGQADFEAIRENRRRWLVTFRDDVVVEQGDSRLRCQTLEIEFRTARRDIDVDGGAPVEVLRAIADGDVIIDSLGTAEGAGAYEIAAARATTTRGTDSAYEIVLEGGTRARFAGSLRAGGQGRIEITSDGPTEMRTPVKSVQPGEPLRGSVRFSGNVIARQWDTNASADSDPAAPTTEIRAPMVTLLGSRRPEDGGRLDPETLSARGTPTDRVDVRRIGVEAQSNTMTWRAYRREGFERLILSGRPTATFDDASGLNPLGDARAQPGGKLIVTATEEIDIRTPRPIEVPGEPTVPATGLGSVHAMGSVVVRRVIEERETYRLSARQVDVGFDTSHSPLNLRAYGDVALVGRGEREGARFAELRGQRMTVQRTPAEGDQIDDPWTSSSVVVIGDRPTLATAKIDEPGSDGAPARHHDIEAEELRYEEGGTLLVARRRARATLDRTAADTEATTMARDGKAFLGPLSMAGTEIRAHLRSVAPANGTEGNSGGPAPRALARIEIKGAVVVETASRIVYGDSATYDHDGGYAVVNGQPARAILRHEGPYESRITSSTIRVEFESTDGQLHRPRRLSCAGGRILAFAFPTATVAGAPPPPPRRLTVSADGPIDLLTRSGSAQRNARIKWEIPDGRGGWRGEGDITGEHVSLEFDPDSDGALRDRVQRATIVGSQSTPAYVTSPQMNATADRIEIEGEWLHVSSPWGRRVIVRERNEGATSREFECDSGSWNLRTYEWQNVLRETVR